MIPHLGDQVRAFVDGTLPPAVMEAYSRHLVCCSTCRASVDAERRLVAALRAPAQEWCPSGLQESLLELAAREALVPPGHVRAQPLPVHRSGAQRGRRAMIVATVAASATVLTASTFTQAVSPRTSSARGGIQNGVSAMMTTRSASRPASVPQGSSVSVDRDATRSDGSGDVVVPVSDTSAELARGLVAPTRLPDGLGQQGNPLVHVPSGSASPNPPTVVVIVDRSAQSTP